jgi:hypothetical protein
MIEANMDNPTASAKPISRTSNIGTMNHPHVVTITNPLIGIERRSCFRSAKDSERAADGNLCTPRPGQPRKWLEDADHQAPRVLILSGSPAGRMMSCLLSLSPAFAKAG